MLNKLLRRYSSWLLRALGVLLFVWILTRAELTKVGETLASIDLLSLAWLPAVTLGQIALRAVRWRLLLGRDGNRMPYSRAFSIYASGVFLGSFTPGRLGDLAKSIYLRREQEISWERAAGVTVTDRVFDLVLLLASGLWALVHFGLWSPLASLLGLGILLSGVVFAFARPRWSAWLSLRQRLERWRGFRFAAGFKAEGIRSVRRAGGWAAALTLLAYAAFFLQTGHLGLVLGLPLSVADITAAIVLVGIASFLPVSIAGFGTRESILVLVMAQRGVPNHFEAALSYSALFFAFCFLLPSLFGFLCWLQRPIALDGIRSAPAASGVNL